MKYKKTPELKKKKKFFGEGGQFTVQYSVQ